MKKFSGWLVWGGFFLLALLVYAPAISGPFQFDDKRVILDDEIREREGVGGFVLASVLPGKVDPLGRGALGPRGLVHASFLAQWKLHGETTWPYHVFNVAIHAVSAWLVFILLTQLLGFLSSELPKSSELSGDWTFWIAVFGGLVFLLHPVQSQAVAYISQRFESMAGMFYLLAVVVYLKARNCKLKVRNLEWYGGAWLAGLAAMSSKEIAITLPVVLVVLEAVVIRRRIKLGNWLILGAFFLLALKIPAQTVMSASSRSSGLTVARVVEQAKVVEGQGQEMTRWTYFLTQLNVVRTYLRLLVLPVRQSLDYDYSLQLGWDGKTVMSLMLHLGMLAVAGWSWVKNKRLVVLGILWFYINLAMTSSVIPIRDVIYEHRLYLSLVGYVLVLVFLIHKLGDKYGGRVMKAAGGLVAVYAVLTLLRSSVWASEVRLWGDGWRKAPEKARTNKNYGFVLTQAGRFGEGIERLERAVELKPEDQDYRITLGAAYLQVRDWEKAKQQFEKAVELRPDKADGWNNLGVAEFQLKRYEAAKAAFEQALARDGEFYMAWLGLGGAELLLKDLEAAEAALERAVEINPEAPEAYRNLAILYTQAKNSEKLRQVRERLAGLDN